MNPIHDQINHQYEDSFKQIVGKETRAFSFWKGRVALYAILTAMNISTGDEVIIPGYTCVVVPNAVRMTGARPVYVDIKPGTYIIDPERVEKAITPHTKVIIIQHTYGIAGPVDEIISLARPKGIKVIEDCAHVLGTKHNGMHLGSFGDAAFFSSQWSKPYTTGLGGIAVTSSIEIASRLEQIQKSFVTPPLGNRLKLAIQYRIYENLYSPQLFWKAQGLLHTLSKMGLFIGSSSVEELEGKPPKDHEWRMSEIQKKIGIGQLKMAEADLCRRNLIKDFYLKNLEWNGWPLACSKNGEVFLRFPVAVKNKSEILQKAKQCQIELGSWFETPLHPIPLGKHPIFGYNLGQCPNSEIASLQVVNLPMNRWITVSEANRTIEFFLKYAQPVDVS